MRSDEFVLPAPANLAKERQASERTFCQIWQKVRTANSVHARAQTAATVASPTVHQKTYEATRPVG
jgi:hypothetical protein